MTRATKQWVVIVWTETVQRYDGRPFAADLGARPGMVEITEARACVWLRGGSAKDVAKARAYLDEERPNGQVLCYPLSERDPLGRARAEALRTSRQNKS